jgi:hypothetical protein
MNGWIIKKVKEAFDGEGETIIGSRDIVVEIIDIWLEKTLGWMNE